MLICFGMEGKLEDTCYDTWQFVLQPQADGFTRLLLFVFSYLTIRM